MIYFLYLASFFSVLCFTQRSKDGFVRSSGVFFLLYQVPLLAHDYKMLYFGTELSVNYDSHHYIAAVLINLLLVFVTVLTFPSPQSASFRKNDGFYKFALIAAILAALVDMSLNLQFLSLDKTERFAGTVSKVPNLFIIEYDWILIVTALGIGLFTKGWRYLGGTIIASMSLLGLAMGMRYYFVVPFLVFYAQFGDRRSVTQRVLLAFVFIIIAPILGSFLDALKGYIIFYEWVSNDGFYDYWFKHSEFSIISGEIGAIGANFWIGLKHNIGNPDFMSYLAAITPGSNRFFDMAAQNRFYEGISKYLSAIEVADGQGTAFGMMLESYYTFGLPVLVFGLTKWIHQLPWSNEMRPLVLSICLYVSINIARNGLVVAISIIKVYAVLFLLYYIFRVIIQFLKIAVTGYPSGGSTGEADA